MQFSLNNAGQRSVWYAIITEAELYLVYHPILPIFWSTVNGMQFSTIHCSTVHGIKFFLKAAAQYMLYKSPYTMQCS